MFNGCAIDDRRFASGLFCVREPVEGLCDNSSSAGDGEGKGCEVGRQRSGQRQGFRSRKSISYRLEEF